MTPQTIHDHNSFTASSVNALSKGRRLTSKSKESNPTSTPAFPDPKNPGGMTSPLQKIDEGSVGSDEEDFYAKMIAELG